MVNLGGNTGRLNSSRLYSVWIKHGHFADAKPCGKSMDKSRRLDIAHRFATLDHPLTTLRQGKFMRKSLTKNSTTTDTNRVIFSSRNHIKTTQEIVLFSPVFCPTIGGRFKVKTKMHCAFPGNTLADAILDRLMHNAHHLPLKGESMRKRLSDLTGGEHLG